MNQLLKSPSQWIGFSCAGLAIGLVAFYVGLNLLKQLHYDRGTKAYEQGKCDEAISEFETFQQGASADEMDDQNIRIKQIKMECEQFKSVSNNQQSGQFDHALAEVGLFAQRYPKSPLFTPLKSVASSLFTSQPMESLAKPSACKQIGNLKDLISSNLVPQFYYSCGKSFAETNDYPGAIKLFESFLNQFPKHSLSRSVKQAYAQTLYDEAQSQGAGNIPPPSRDGATGNGETVLEIRNDSPEKMRIVLGGPTPRLEELEPCKDCQKYTDNPPKTCPNKGPVGTYTVDPGQYRVVVKSIGGSTVTPYTGDWNLNGNSRYRDCFFIVRRPLSSPVLPDLNRTNKP